MSVHERGEGRPLLRTLLLVVLILAGAAGGGFWLGGLSVPDVPRLVTPPKAAGPIAATNPPRENTAPENTGKTVEPPPLLLAVNPAGGDWTPALGEIALAAKRGFHTFVVPLQPPWPGAEDRDPPEEVIRRITDVDPQARLILRLNLNPPKSWLDEHPGDTMQVGGAPQPYASTASAAWLKAATDAIDTVLNMVEKSGLAPRVTGYVFEAVAHGQWYRGAGFDESPATLAGFRAWLKTRYKTDEALGAAWGIKDISFATAAIPPAPDTSDTKSVFFRLPEEQPVVDYLRFTSENTADALAALCAYTAPKVPETCRLLAPYGFCFELPGNDAGHYALGLLLDSDLDGFFSPVSYVDRGLGGVGGMMGPVNSAVYHGKQWFIVDDTRTHITFDAVSGTASPIQGIRPGDVYNVQRRNFTLALVQGLGLTWADPQGLGWLHDENQWAEFAKMRDIYTQFYPGASRQEATPPPSPSDFLPDVLVVVDESARFYQRCAEPLNRRILTGARDAALRAGVSTQFCLLQDVLDDVAPPAPVCLFLNAFHITKEEREKLFNRFERDQTCAIWLYAPGYIGETSGVDNVRALTGMSVKAFEAPTEAGSVFSVAGQQYVPEGTSIGAPQTWFPLFYIDDEEAFELAKYRGSGKTSVAMRSMDAGWTSVYVAEPAFIPGLLREVLNILEQPLLFEPTRPNHYDLTHEGNGLLAIHGRTIGERSIDLGSYMNVRDLFNEQIGWPQKDRFTLPMKAGETRLFKLSPL